MALEKAYDNLIHQKNMTKQDAWLMKTYKNLLWNSLSDFF